MANKSVPAIISGVTLHDLAMKRMNVLLQLLEDHGVTGLTEVKSQSDRIRLLATFIFNQPGVLDTYSEESEGSEFAAKPGSDPGTL